MNDAHILHPLYSTIDHLLMTVASPGRYAGVEFNSIRKDLRAIRLRWGIVHPDLYETGFGIPELAILYHLLNRHPDVAAERCYRPDRDLETVLERRGLPLFTLETRTPLRELDVVHVHADNVLAAVNIPALLEQGGLHALAADRGEDEPVVVLSGALAFTPEPVADLVDLVLVGELEDVVEAFVEQWRRAGFAGADRTARIGELAQTLDGAYWPAAHAVDTEPGCVAWVTGPGPAGLPDRIAAARVFDFERAPTPARPVVAGIRTPHDRLRVEIQRGRASSDSGAQFRLPTGAPALSPVRTRSRSRVFEILETQYAATGHDVLVLNGTHPASHPDLAAILAGLEARIGPAGMHMIVPGLPASDQLDLLDPEGRVVPGAGGGTGAQLHLDAVETSPALARILEAAWDRDRLHDLAVRAYRRGFAGIVAHAVIGVPGERDGDVAAIGILARQLSAARREVDGRYGRLEWTVSAWIPGPHGPGEREAMAPIEELRRKLGLIRQGLGRRRDVRCRWSSLDLALVETLLLRSDRRMGPALLSLARDGVRFTTSTFGTPEPDLSVERFLAAAGLESDLLHHPEKALGQRTPWSHIDVS